MPLEAPFPSPAEQAKALNARTRHHGATAVLEHALANPRLGRIAMVSSFGAESVVLLHLISILDRTTPVIFIDTEMLFAETLAYQSELADRLALIDVRRITATPEALLLGDPDNTLQQRDKDACCHLRKIQPLETALAPFDAWITGRKRYQSGTRAEIEFFEPDGDSRIKVNPLARWNRDDLRAYMDNNNLPRHPLVAKGYPSIGCTPCTTPVREGEDPRAGRWRDEEKSECGIHFVDGKMVRIPFSEGLSQ